MEGDQNPRRQWDIKKIVRKIKKLKKKVEKEIDEDDVCQGQNGRK